MANTRSDTAIPPNTWVNLYGGTNVAVGTAVDLWNKGTTPLQVAVSLAAPTDNKMGIPLYSGETGYLNVAAGEVGLWAYNPYKYTGYILVQE